MSNTSASFPVLYQTNPRYVLNELAPSLGRSATLDDLLDADLDRLAEMGFDWIWLLGVWQTGPAGMIEAQQHAGLNREYRLLLPDFTEADVCGSPFAVQQYIVHEDFGGDDALFRLRARLKLRGLKLLLDFVPNHTALDHPWVAAHPEWYIQGTRDLLAREPGNYRWADTHNGPRILAHGRDPYFPGWTDTFQLNYRHPGLRAAMIAQLIDIASKCEGVRCDMSMLLLPDIVRRTWGERSLPADGLTPVDESFWPTALERVRASRPGFLFMAEVYWDLEWQLQQQGFDYTYDKRLYDRLHAQDAPAVRVHLHAEEVFQQKSARFLENHDEPRAAAAFPLAVHPSAALITYFTPGLRFFHQGQLEGRQRRSIIQLARRPNETIDPTLKAFYLKLLECLRRPEVHSGRWTLLRCRPAWDGNPTWDRFFGFLWDSDDGGRLLVVVNYGGMQGQCYVELPLTDLLGQWVILRDLLGVARYERDGTELTTRGLYLDLPAWGTHIFEMSSP